jgi:hypothetical protein
MHSWVDVVGAAEVQFADELNIVVLPNRNTPLLQISRIEYVFTTN